MVEKVTFPSHNLSARIPEMSGFVLFSFFLLVFFLASFQLYLTLLLHKERKKVKALSHVRLFVTPWTVAHQAPLSMGFSRQEYWSGLPFPSPGDLPDPGIAPGSPALQADSLPFEPPGTRC